MKSIKWIIFGLILCLQLTNLQAQDNRTALEKKRKQLEKEISNTQTQLKKTEATRKASLNDLQTLDKQITLRKELITNTSQEVTVYSHQIDETSKSLSQLQSELESLRLNYGRAIYVTYKNYRITDKFFFIASASSFSESFRRINYLRKISQYRKKQVDAIIETSTKISSALNEIQQKKMTKEQLLNQQVKQQNALNRNKVQKQKLVEQLKQKESDLSKKLAKQKQEAEKLNAQIQNVIAKEIEEQRKKQEKLAAENAAKNEKAAKDAEKKGLPAPKPILTETPAVDKLSASFVSNKGRLPWPVDKGYISRGFGTYQHPELNNVILENNGIDIKTSANSGVKAVFDGKVVGVISNPTYKNAIIVSHGDYFTVYSKLESVSVQKGQTITAKQVIGTVYTDSESGDSDVHFEVWKGSIKLNPADWIARR